MKPSFVETMRGSLSPPGGEASPVVFEVVAEAASTRALLRTGHTELRGLIRAPAWVDEAPTRGSLDLSPRRLEYRLRFVDRQGRDLLLLGRKHPRPLAALHSMTVMETLLLDDRGGELARGELRFDLRELPPFLWSWLPLRHMAQRRLDIRRRAVERQAWALPLGVGP